MGSEIEIPETPNWLKELEAKRERRLKTKLGHELGAGAPCLTCEDKCPGLDLHFWRKICKSCKCSKENHEVLDDDIYGWAQDELLGTKVNRLKRKIVLPGRKDKEVELEWAPNGQKDTIDKYLKSVPTELLPIKGSQAAQDRKQMLKKQIPVHDIDPTLCHELTEAELQKMQEYVAHIKQSSVGVGHLIQINFNKGKTHVMDKNDAMFLINNVPKGIVTSEKVILHGGDNVSPLNMREPVENETDVKNPVYPSFRDKQNAINDLMRKNNVNSSKHNVLDPVGNKVVTEDVQVPQETCLRDLSYSYDDYSVSTPTNVNERQRLSTEKFGPSAFVPIKLPEDNQGVREGVELNLGSAKGLPYPSQFIQDTFKYRSYNPIEEQNPAYFQPIRDENTSNTYTPQNSSPYNAFKPESPFRTIEKQGGYNPTYDRRESQLSKSIASQMSLDNNDETLLNLNRSENFPHYVPAKNVAYENHQSPSKIRNVKDLAYSTYEKPPCDDFNNLSVKDRLNRLKQKELAALGPASSPISERNLSPSKFTVKDRIMNLTPSFSNPQTSEIEEYSSLKTPRADYQSFTPGNREIHEDELQPSFIPVGAIRDIEYENPDVRSALSKHNDAFIGSTPKKIEPNLNSLSLPCCHYCKRPFEQEELAIAIPERSDAIYHTECFKCSGCNQILADMFYFYDKSSNNIYCGRDYAKIRGIPRCMACDELIFVKEYCLAENSTFHVKHFCCFECDKPLADQNYVMENNQPVCLPCYELTKANKCYACKEVIHPDQQGLQLKDDVHFHATDECFACKVCKKSLFGAKLLFRNDCLYCSHDCFNGLN